MDQTQAQPHSEVSTPMGSAGRLVGIYTSPKDTFQSIRERPGWILPVVLMIVVGMIGFNLIIERMGGMDRFFQTQMSERQREQFQQRGQDPDEAARQQANSAIGTITRYAGPPIGVLIGVFAVAGLFQLFLSLLGGEAKFKRTVSVVAHGWWAYTLVYQALAVLIAYLSSQPETIDINNVVQSNLGVLVSKDQEFLHSLLSSLDVLSFWQIWLMSLGLTVVTPNITRGKVTGMIVGLWAVYVLAKATVSTIF